MFEILLQAFCHSIENQANQNKRCFSVASNFQDFFFGKKVSLYFLKRIRFRKNPDYF
jgi:hypothetical protein